MRIEDCFFVGGKIKNEKVCILVSLFFDGFVGYKYVVCIGLIALLAAGIKIPPMDKKLEIYSAESREKRRKWVELCSKCHSSRFAGM